MYRILETTGDVNSTRDLAVDVLVGLSESPKRLPSRLFYDAEGSRLFAQISDASEYYLTRVEHEILERNVAAITAPLLQAPFNLIDLGAGDGRKTNVILEHLLNIGADVRYVPIDISEAAIADLCARTRKKYPTIPVTGLVSEYFQGIRWLAEQGGRRNLVLFLGSNIGNFDRSGAHRFLRGLWNAMEPNDLLLAGFDLKKDPEVLLHAYNDSQGLTRDFNLNLLKRINRELGGHFDLDKFRHFSTYNVFSGAMESYLLSLESQTVVIDALEHSFDFEPFEPVHTEYSFKYLDKDVDNMAEATGFVIEDRYFDEHHHMCDALWRVEKLSTT